MSQPDSAHLFLTEGSSDKEYRLDLRPVGDLWETVAHFGKRGSVLKEHKKTPAPVSFDAARKEYDKALRSKTKEGYTSDVSGEVVHAPPARDVLAYLDTIPDDINDGFRRPDLAWEMGAAKWLGQVGGDGIFSNFWVGPSDTAKTFAGHLACEMEAFSKTVEVDPEDGQELGLFVGYWENPALGLGMVGTISFTEDFMLDGADRPNGFPSIKRFSRVMQQVACDGNDNSPYEIVSWTCYAEGKNQPESEKLRLFDFVRSVSMPSLHSDLEQQMERNLPGYKALKDCINIHNDTAPSQGVAKPRRV